PAAEKFFYRWYGSQEFIKGIERWVLWLGNATPAELRAMPEVMKRVQAVRDYRLQSRRAQTKKAADRPNHFGTEVIPEGNALLIPEVSSERRRYIPIGFVGADPLCRNNVRLVPEATRYQFGSLHSRVHNAWMRTVTGRLKSDYSYSTGTVYNNFIWPEVTENQKSEIADLAQCVLNAREVYSDATIAQMYDPDHGWLYPELAVAHHTLDTAVERAYELEPGCDEKIIVERLFKLYANAVNREHA